MKEEDEMVAEKKNDVAKKTVSSDKRDKKTCVVKELTMKTPRLVGPVCQN